MKCNDDIDINEAVSQTALGCLLEDEQRKGFDWNKYTELLSVCNWSYYHGFDDEDYRQYWTEAEPLEFNEVPGNFQKGLQALEEMFDLFPRRFYGEVWDGTVQWVSEVDPSEDEHNYWCSMMEDFECQDPTRKDGNAHGQNCEIDWDHFTFGEYESWDSRDVLLTRYLKELM